MAEQLSTPDALPQAQPRPIAPAGAVLDTRATAPQPDPSGTAPSPIPSPYATLAALDGTGPDE